MTPRSGRIDAERRRQRRLPGSPDADRPRPFLVRVDRRPSLSHLNLIVQGKVPNLAADHRHECPPRRPSDGSCHVGGTDRAVRGASMGQRTNHGPYANSPTFVARRIPPRFAPFAQRHFGVVDVGPCGLLGGLVGVSSGQPHRSSGGHQLVDQFAAQCIGDRRVGRPPSSAVDEDPAATLSGILRLSWLNGHDGTSTSQRRRGRRYRPDGGCAWLRRRPGALVAHAEPANADKRRPVRLLQ